MNERVGKWGRRGGRGGGYTCGFGKFAQIEKIDMKDCSITRS